MKKLFQVAVPVFSILIFCIQSVNACEFTGEPLRKTFRRSKAVFIAEVKDVQFNESVDHNKSLVDGQLTFEIFSSWKGNFNNRVTLPANIANTCGCYSFREFKTGKKYIVFVDKKSVVHICDSDEAKTESGAEKIKNLNNFWFRTWARIYPF